MIIFLYKNSPLFLERNPGFLFFFYCRNVASILHDNGHRWNIASTFHHFRLFITFNLGNTLGAFGLPFPRCFSVQNLQTCSCYLNHSLSLFSLICSIAYCRQCRLYVLYLLHFFELILATTHSFPHRGERPFTEFNFPDMATHSLS